MTARFVAVFATLAGCGFRAPAAIHDADPDAIGDGTGMTDSPSGTDASIDVPPVPADAEQCFGSGVVRVCLATLPPTPRNFSASTQIDTDGAICEIATNPEAVGLCVLSGAGIQIDSGRTLSARGSRPLVLVSTLNIAVLGTIDVASRGATTGAGGEPAAAGACVLGTQATSGGSSGGGYGGSFGGKGANGESNDGGTGGVAPAIVAAIKLRGGCVGGLSIFGGSTAPGGHGGGAVALLAAGTIQVMGSINASGGGGRQGQLQKQGAGGGGSGGMIVLDAPQIANQGGIFANGGGGGEGNGVAGGNPGDEPTVATTAAAGGAGNTPTGGDGGAGSLGGNGGAPPGNASNNGGGGGGGGGGAGVIKASTTISGNAPSPAATP